MHELFPREVTTHVPRITLTGDEMLCVEQHRGLVKCELNTICLMTASGLMTIEGKGLHMRQYSAQEAVIAGQISALLISPEGRRR